MEKVPTIQVRQVKKRNQHVRIAIMQDGVPEFLTLSKKMYDEMITKAIERFIKQEITV
jgi:hypothetical protein